VPTMRGLLADAGALLDRSESDVEARLDLSEKLETMLDLVCMQNNSLHRPQINALSPPLD
jgi:hypothetical protein